MKHAACIFVFFLSFPLLNNLFAQKKPPRVEVTVYLTDGDSLQGTTLLEKGWLKGNFTGTDVSYKIEVKKADSWKTKVYKPDDIKGYTLVFEDGREARFYSSVNNSFIPQKLKEFPSGLYGLSHKPAFLLYVTGKILKDYRRFYSEMNSGYHSSSEEVYLIKNDKEVFEFSKRGFDYEVKWRKRLWEYLAECPDLVEKIKPGMYHTYPSHLICQDYEKCVSDLKN